MGCGEPASSSPGLLVYLLELLMRRWIKSLSFETEFASVMLIGFGYFTVGSIIKFISFLGTSSATRVVISNTHLYFTVFYEIIALLIIVVFLSIRNWTIYNFNLNISLRLTGAGILLALADYAILIIMFMLMSPLLIAERSVLSNYAPGFSDLDITAITFVSMINPVYEEVLVVGYVIAALKSRKSAWFAINVSVTIRLLYHLYQGPIAAVAIVPMGLLFAFVYVKTERLWPLIVAHGIMDFIALTAH